SERNIQELETVLVKLRKPIEPAPRSMPYTFARKPCVVPVPECEEKPDPTSTTDTHSDHPSRSSEVRLVRQHLPRFENRFDQPAHFPIPRFGLEGDRLNSEGVVIYEGMRFVARSDGQYKVTFTTSAP